MTQIDLNADAGEAFGHWQLTNEAALFPSLTSVNLACGFHAGDPLTMQRSVALAKSLGVAVGAHPGFPDKVGFGRRDMALSSDELYADVLYQLGALHAFLRLQHMPLHHVKPHGSLYLKMMRDEMTARAVAQAVGDFDAKLPLVILGGPGGQTMLEQAAHVGVVTVTEAFPDRAYLANGQLAPRSYEGAVLDDPSAVAERAVAMASGQPFAALDGGEVSVQAETFCIHGDHPNSAQTAQAVRRALEDAGIQVKAF